MVEIVPNIERVLGNAVKPWVVLCRSSIIAIVVEANWCLNPVVLEKTSTRNCPPCWAKEAKLRHSSSPAVRRMVLKVFMGLVN
jgi:hypothetical protein